MGERTNGCRGCHIGPDASYPYFGDTQEQVESFLRFFDGGAIVIGGWDGSVIASFLRTGFMPLGGVFMSSLLDIRRLGAAISGIACLLGPFGAHLEACVTS